jgi:hypothetical protein
MRAGLPGLVSLVGFGKSTFRSSEFTSNQKLPPAESRTYFLFYLLLGFLSTSSNVWQTGLGERKLSPHIVRNSIEELSIGPDVL